MIRIGSVDGDDVDAATDADAEWSAEVSSARVWPQMPQQRVSAESRSATP